MKTEHFLSKGYLERQKVKPRFGIGASLEDIRGNVGLTMVQRENVWHPYYEVTMEDATDLKAAFMANTADRRKDGGEGAKIL
jgi:hypothetical protein